jgi:hypothetical protein
MQKNPDPVDQAFDVLRESRWESAGHHTQLEEVLMSEFQRPQSSGFFSQHRALCVAAGILLVGGVSFAASSTLRSWLVRVEVGDQVAEVEVGENGSKTMTIETPDGGLATVTVEKSTANGDETRVEVRRSSADGREENVDAVVRKTRREMFDDSEYSMDDLGDAEPNATWASADYAHAIYLLPGKDNNSTRMFVSTTTPEGETEVRLAGTPPIVMWGEVTPDVSVGDDGTLTISLKKDGNEQVIKMKIAVAHDDEADLPDDGSIDIETPDGVRVKISETDDE